MQRPHLLRCQLPLLLQAAQDGVQLLPARCLQLLGVIEAQLAQRQHGRRGQLALHGLRHGRRRYFLACLICGQKHSCILLPGCKLRACAYNPSPVNRAHLQGRLFTVAALLLLLLPLPPVLSPAALMG